MAIIGSNDRYDADKEENEATPLWTALNAAREAEQARQTPRGPAGPAYDAVKLLQAARDFEREWAVAFPCASTSPSLPWAVREALIALFNATPR